MKLKINVTENEILSMPHDETLGRWVRKKFWEMSEHQIMEREVEYDHCVICGRQSPYTRNTPIDERIGYVEGGGQTCFNHPECEN